MTQATIVITPEQVFEHWQGHRRLTRRMIEAFPEDKLFAYSIGGMRPFAELVLEMLDMAAPGTQGIATGQWETTHPTLRKMKEDKPKTKASLLHLWDESTKEIDRLWPLIPPARFQVDDVAFGQWPNKVFATLFYFIDNEIHHRAQGYVYLRSLGIEPPAFWDRS
jgi:uncharacterized damage-inducible protein DinB